MAFNIIWSDFAEGQLDAIFEYYSENAGLNVAKRILQKIIAEPDKIIMIIDIWCVTTIK